MHQTRSATLRHAPNSFQPQLCDVLWRVRWKLKIYFNDRQTDPQHSCKSPPYTGRGTINNKICDNANSEKIKLNCC